MQELPEDNSDTGSGNNYDNDDEDYDSDDWGSGDDEYGGGGSRVPDNSYNSNNGGRQSVNSIGNESPRNVSKNPVTKSLVRLLRDKDRFRPKK